VGRKKESLLEGREDVWCKFVGVCSRIVADKFF
jgi:hypothetical protein